MQEGSAGNGVSDRTSVAVTPSIAIPRSELLLRASRSGGAGGQHVNTSSTRIELLWRPATTSALSEDARRRVARALAARLDGDGWLRIVSSEHRSQLRNRRAAEERLADLVRGALVVRKRRTRTTPSRAAKQARLDDKRRRSDRKRDRRRDDD
ncbi:MAG: alternative ribosome rescue aminoacyl-tRNA hydrolase ArfB [Gemmatimonadaceae bacterium]